jgi:outer membrane protein assembly factor BamD (BamD/ComL family)
LPKGTRTLERQAIDLVAQGQYGKAVDIYDQLAQQHPEQPAFKEAARLLRQRTNGP